MDPRVTEVIAPRGGRTSPPRQAIFFDGDDTLWVTQWLYDQAEQETRLIVESAGLDGARWQEICKERDFANVAKFGFNAGRFPTSVVSAYTKLCEESAVPVQLEIVRDLMQAASSMFRRKAPLVPGVAEVLRALQPDFQLVLVTKGDIAVQRKRIRDSGLERYFDRIVIVADKNQATFETVCRDIGADIPRSWSVGNSLPSDVAPAMAAGLRGVWVEANVWDYEKRDPGKTDGVEKLGTLRELPALIRRLGGPRRTPPGRDGVG